MALITVEMVYEQNKQILSLLDRLITNGAVNDLQEVSLDEACDILGRGQKTVMKYVEKGALKARKEQMETPKRGRWTKYIFLVRDIKEFQENGKHAVVKSADIPESFPVEVKTKSFKEEMREQALLFKETHGSKKSNSQVKA